MKQAKLRATGGTVNRQEVVEAIVQESVQVAQDGVIDRFGEIARERGFQEDTVGEAEAGHKLESKVFFALLQFIEIPGLGDTLQEHETVLQRGCQAENHQRIVEEIQQSTVNDSLLVVFVATEHTLEQASEPDGEGDFLTSATSSRQASLHTKAAYKHLATNLLSVRVSARDFVATALTQ